MLCQNFDFGKITVDIPLGETECLFFCQKYFVTGLVTRFNTAFLGFVTNMNLMIKVVKNNSKQVLIRRMVNQLYFVTSVRTPLVTSITSEKLRFSKSNHENIENVYGASSFDVIRENSMFSKKMRFFINPLVTRCNTDKLDFLEKW